MAYLGLIAWARNWIAADMRQVKLRLRAGLQSSGLLERLALEGTPAQRAIDYVPLALKPLFPRLSRRRPTLPAELEMVGNNLGWYLRAPAPLFKFGWISGLGALLLILGNQIAQSFSGHAAGVGGLDTTLTIISYAYLLCIPYMLTLQREAVSRGVLAEELLKRLDLGVENKVSDPALRAELGPPQLSANAAARDVADAG
jgi:hypothetical protein